MYMYMYIHIYIQSHFGQDSVGGPDPLLGYTIAWYTRLAYTAQVILY